MRSSRPDRPCSLTNGQRPRPVAVTHRSSRHSLFDEQRAHRLLLADAPHRLGQQARDRQHADLPARLAPRRAAGSCRSRPARRAPSFAMRSTAGPDSTGCVQYATTFSAPRSFSACAACAQRAGGVDHVVDDHARAAFDFADDVHHLATFGRGRRLSMIARSALEPLRERARAHHAADVRRHDDQVLVTRASTRRPAAPGDA